MYLKYPQCQLQREAIETAIWLNELAAASNVGNRVLSELQGRRLEHVNGLPRTAFKMATGTGKTVVMAALILYHYLNRSEYRNDTRFADYFLLVAPGITIRDRLGVLRVDTVRRDRHNASDYYRQRGLVPPQLANRLEGLNARLVITNYHSFESKTLQGNKRSPFDGKQVRLVDENTGEIITQKRESLEDFNQVMKRLGIKSGSRLLIINDEAHHCYLPREKGRITDGENTQEENARAAVWFRGIEELCNRCQVRHIYDLSATPYYLNGSGYDAYSLFPWVVSDFGLIEAIESGLVKIPFLPELDNTQELEMPVLLNLYEHIKQHLPKMGASTVRKEAKKAGKATDAEQPPNMSQLGKLVSALEQFYEQYEKDHQRVGALFGAPPVFIVVCNNTSVSKEIYKYIAGFETVDEEGNRRVHQGKYALFNNFDEYDRPRPKPPTLLIDSSALENPDQVDDGFKKVFASEIEAFKRDYARLHGQTAAQNITDSEILREVVNTVGKPNSLGSHVRCVVSVSMLTEGWDANTVTHIMGVRAFGSQLLCEQVAGRALRRQRYDLQAYCPKTGETLTRQQVALRKPANVVYKFPPEYAQIIGIPFRNFKSGQSEQAATVEYTRIEAIPERQTIYEIRTPNVTGYRVETDDGPLKADFSRVPNYEVDFNQIPLETIMGNAFSPEKHLLEMKTSIREIRDQSVVYRIAQKYMSVKLRGLDGKVGKMEKFNQVLSIVEEWYKTKVVVVGETDPELKKVLYKLPNTDYLDLIEQGIIHKQREIERILPILNHYNRIISTKNVIGSTSRPVFATIRSHVNYVVADTESWEQLAAKTLEETPAVISYVKNAFLNFVIPYIKDNKERSYYPDFVAYVQTPSGKKVNLIIEVTGLNTDKAEKRFYVENRWLPAVNAVREQLGMDEWAFLEIADARYFKNQLHERIQTL